MPDKSQGNGYMGWESISNALLKGRSRYEHPVDKCLLVQGDSREVLSRIPSATVGCAITSPPYGNQKNYGSHDEVGAGSHNQYLADMAKVLDELHRACAEGAALWVVMDTIKRSGNAIPLPWDMIKLAQQAGWSFHDIIVWDKGRSLPWSHNGHFRGVCEFILLLSNGKKLRHFNIDAIRELDHLSSYWIRYPERYNPKGKAPSDLWHFPTPVQGSWSRADLRHLCPFPTALVTRMIALTTQPGDIVLDPFAGTGTVPAAAAEMGRYGLGIELSERYVADFATTNYAAVTREASLVLKQRPSRSKVGLSALIPDLRANKLPRTLFAQVTRPDRLPANLADKILAFVAQRDLRTRNGYLAHVRLAVLVSDRRSARRIDRVCNAVLRVPPLSKFEVSVHLTVLSPTDWLKCSSVKFQRSAKWYRYTNGCFNYYRDGDELTWLELRAALTELSPRLRRPRVPPIFSNISLRTKPGISE